MSVLYIFITIIGFSFLIMGIITIANLSFAPKFDKVFANEKIICLIQELQTSDDDNGIIITSYYKLHVVDSKTGKRLQKKKMGRNNLTFLNLVDTSILMEIRKDSEFKSIQIIDAINWTVIQEFSSETLPTMFSEFALGVAEDIKYEEEYELLKAFAKDGKCWYINPYKKEILPENIVKKQNVKNFVSYPYSLDGDKLKYVVDEKNDHVFKNLAFIEGEILKTDKILKRLWLASYKTTDKKEAKLHCLSFEPKIMWETDPVKLKFNSIAKKKADFNIATTIGANVLFNYGGVS